MEEYTRHGCEEEPIEIEAGEILEAIKNGRSIHIEHGVIRGDLDISKIDLEPDENGKRIIRGQMDIHYTEVKGDVRLNMASFRENVSFSYVCFRNDVSCAVSIFHRDCLFYEVNFRRNANFTGADFRGDYCSFDDIRFNRYALFAEARFYKYVTFRSITMDRPGDFRDVKFCENTVSKRLKDYIFRPLVWLITMGRVKLTMHPVTVFSLNTNTVMDSSTNPYLKRYIEDEQWIRSWRHRSKWRKFLFYVWEITSHCGRSFSLWMILALVAAVIFGAVYADYTVPSWMPGPMKSVLVSIDPKVKLSTDGRTPTCFTPYYFSIVTFTTLGFGDIEPQGLAGEIWLALEVVLGYVMLGGLISIFANKLARRS